MKTILLVDDDSLARIGIKSMVDFSTHGYTIIGEADNGQKALQMIEASPPDIVLCDVKMPGLDGVQLLDAVRSEGIHSSFIMLSSHDDFQYVKEALVNGATDYILKMNISEEVILQALSKATGGVHQTISPTGTTIERQIRALLFDPSRLTVDKDKVGELLGLKNAPYCSIIVKVLASSDAVFTDSDFQRLEGPTRNVCEEIVQGIHGARTFFLGGRTYLLVVPLELNQLEMQEFRTFLDSLFTQMEQMFHFVLNAAPAIGVSSVHTTGSEFRRSLVEGQKASQEAIVNNCRHTFYQDIIYQDKDDGSSVALERQVAVLQEALCSLNRERIDDAFFQFRRTVSSGEVVSMGRIRGLGYMLLYVVNNFLSFVDIGNTESDFEHALLSIATQEDFLVWVSRIHSQLVGLLESSEGTLKQITNAKAYIQQYHADEKLTLESVASEVGLSPTYFSKVFYQATGSKFIDYLTQVRIEHAQQLLRTSNYKVLAIAQMVGYSNTTYFSFLFKKKTGKTPQEYRQV